MEQVGHSGSFCWASDFYQPSCQATKHPALTIDDDLLFRTQLGRLFLERPENF